MLLSPRRDPQGAAQLVPTTLDPLVAETGHAVELLQDRLARGVRGHLGGFSGVGFGAGRGSARGPSEPRSGVPAHQGPDVSVGQGLAAAAQRSHRPPRSIPGFVDPQIQVGFFQLGDHVLRLQVFFSCRLRLVLRRLRLLVRTLRLGQEGGGGFGNDPPVPADVLCGGELGGDGEADDAPAVDLSRDQVEGPGAGQPPQQLLGRSVSCLQASNHNSFSS